MTASIQPNIPPRISAHWSVERRFEAHYIPEPNSGCWLWVGDIAKPTGGDRPQFIVNGKRVRGHRFAYEKFVGPITGGLYVCHRCHNSLCVNPDHLYLGTAKQNTQDMMRAGRHFSQSNPAALRALIERVKGYSAKRAAATHCKFGHPFSGDNLLVSKTGRRRCRTCRVAYGKKYYAAAMEAACQ